MAYPVETVVTELGEAASEIEIALPAHKEDDVVFVCVAQDGVATLSSPGAPWVVLSAGNAGGAGRLVMYAVAGASQLPDPIVTSNITDGINAIAVVVRDADITNPIDASNFSAVAGTTMSSPTVTTTTANALMLACIVEDQETRGRFDITALNILGQSFDGVVTNIMGYRVAETPGAAPAISGGTKIVSDTTQFFYVAVRNKLGGALPPECTNGPVPLASYGTVAITATEITTLIPDETVIDGITLRTAINGWLALNTYTGEGEWDRMAGFRTNTFTAGQYPSSANLLFAAYHSIAETNFLSGLISFRFRREAVSTEGGVAKNGWYLFVFDVNGNWAAYNYLKKADVPGMGYKTVVFDFSKITPTASSATPLDLTRVDRLGYGYHRLMSANMQSRATYFSQLFLWPHDSPLTISGGSPSAPATPYALGRLVQAYRLNDVFSLQGSGQVACKVPVKLGNSGGGAIGLGRGSSMEFRRLSAEQRVGDMSMRLVIEAAANDTADFKYGAFGSAVKSLLKASDTSSPSANYEFEGASFFGVEVQWNPNIPLIGANFFDCYAIDAGGAEMSECKFSSFLSLSGVTTSNPANISNCEFTQGDSGGHAIEITQPGTFAFVGNTFSGYGLDGTTDAAIYNNSGGHVVLNVSGGGDTPTVRNGAGATTEVVSGAQVTVVGLATGSQVKVTKVSNGDVLFNGAESGGQISFSTTYIGAVRVDARKASASPFYKPWATQATTISGQTVEVTALQELDE